MTDGSRPEFVTFTVVVPSDWRVEAIAAIEAALQGLECDYAIDDGKQIHSPSTGAI